MRLLRILKQVLLELFDESAYLRYCARNGVARSVASYRDFRAERESAHRPKLKCC